MGEPTVEDSSVAKKVKLEQSDTEGPEAKKLKVENSEIENGVEVKKENDSEVKKENDSEVKKENDSEVKKENDSEVKKENGAKCDTQTEEEKGVPGIDEIITHQIEYYFGNINLPRDKFLQEQIKLDDGWVPLEVMLRFQRLAKLSKKPETITSALKKHSSLMEVSEDGTKIRRSPNKPLPEMNEEWQKQLNERTVYCKGFPQSLVVMSTYLDFFKPYGPVEHINLRKYLDRTTKKLIYKGSAYILFETKEAADKFLSLESVKFEETELIRMTHAAHTAEKKKEKDERWGKKVKKDNANAEQNEKEKNNVQGKDLSKGCILKISEIKDEELSRDTIKTTLVGLGANVAFVQYSKGDKEALVRLASKEDGAATEFVKKLADNGEKVKFGEDEMAVTVLEGEEEEAFLKRSRESFQASRQNRKGHKHHKGGHKNFRGHKRGRSPAKDGPPAKKEASS
ncbi:La protein-like protein [Frankliniella fusca]|uniref:La protein-like protein n=1 Tax=Frankliniella fusca TaxID=407009 RepID=A0AAE1GV19_9NEOP|nr:La protein-like protein [Frankliniella fusca]